MDSQWVHQSIVDLTEGNHNVECVNDGFGLLGWWVRPPLVILQRFKQFHVPPDMTSTTLLLRPDLDSGC